VIGPAVPPEAAIRAANRSPAHPSAGARASLVLVGMPGCGKTTVARHLARQLGLRFADSDHEIERRVGASVRDIFAHEGEEGFRVHEERVISELADEAQAHGLVLATGGGAVLRPANRDALRRAGTVFYLRSTAEELHRRLRHDGQRPLLQVADPLRKLRELYRDRDPLYRRTAHYVVEAARPSVQSLIGMVLMQLELAGLVDPAQVPSPVDVALAAAR
jgi:shikimate kinase